MSSQVLDFTISCSQDIKVHFSKYSNGCLLILTQVNKLGTYILAELENPESQSSEKIFNVQVKFGDRCDEWSLALSRGIIEKLSFPRVLIIISIVTKTPETFNLILNSIG